MRRIRVELIERLFDLSLIAIRLEGVPQIHRFKRALHNVPIGAVQGCQHGGLLGRDLGSELQPLHIDLQAASMRSFTTLCGTARTSFIALRKRVKASGPSIICGDV